MRQTVEHLGPQHKAVDLMIDDTTVLRVCPEFEMRRYEFMKPVLRQHGEMFPKSPFDEAFPKGDYSQRCYDQAAALMLCTDLVYCEGVMLVELAFNQGLFAMPHAWCCKADKSVVDPTAHKLQNHRRIRYLGMPFKHTYVIEWYRKWGYHGILDGHPELGDTVGPYVDPVERWHL